MKIVFCSSEIVPFVKTGGLADVCGTLPHALQRLGHELTLILPAYGSIDRDKFKVRKAGPGVLTTTVGEKITVYFVDEEKYFHRAGIYGDSRGDYPDNLSRFSFFCRRSLEILKQYDVRPDVIHCHDWQTALLPVYLKVNFLDELCFQKTRTVLSLHNLAFQGLFEHAQFGKLGLPEGLYRAYFEFYGKVNLLKAGILFSDKVATVSPQYAREIQTAEFGCGLDGVLRSRGDEIVGILNGIDYDSWDPATDELIAARYTPQEPDNKKANKQALQKMFRLPVNDDVPVYGFVGRLSHQKGIDLISDAFAQLAKLDLQMVFLGTGEDKYHRLLEKWHQLHRQKVGLHLKFSEPIAHEVYAGSDLFLMPSVYEPCGLSQMISLKYGSVPLVFRTGGLADTIKPYDQGGNGFVFDEYSVPSFVAAVKKSLKAYQDRKTFAKIMAAAFASDFPWQHSARLYMKLYEQCRKQ